MLTGSDQTTVPDRTEPDLSNCELEPIHVPGSIQPHGVLLVLAAADLSLVQASANAAELLGVPHADALGRPLGRLLGADTAGRLAPGLTAAPAGTRPVFLRTVEGAAGRAFHAVAHRADGGIVLELEAAPPAAPDADPTPDVHPLLDAFTLRAEDARGVDELCRLTCREVRRLTGFDRVLVYRFDEGWNGTVVGEDGSGRLPSYLHHRFPASDIPAQARELYRLNRLRLIPDAGYRPVPVVPADNPVTGRPLDLSFSTLRSVSPVHVEYMRNMGTAASMSVSILRDGRLWGLVSCHHAGPRAVPFPTRGACDLLARAFSLRLSALEHARDYERRIGVRSAYSNLLAVMADRGDFAAALGERAGDLLALADAGSAAVLTEDGRLRVGDGPAEAEVRDLAGWLFTAVRQEVYSTDSLPAAYPPAGAYKDRASGLLAVAVSKLHPSYVLWFRPEVVRTVRWGGDPTKPADPGGGRVQLHPRKSFETWRETVRDKSLPWDPSEVEGAAELRNAIVGTVLRRAEELAGLNAELTRSNTELEAFSYSVSRDLRAPLRHIVGYAEMLKDAAAGALTPRGERCVRTIIESSEYAGRLVDKLLGYSRLGRSELQRSRVDLNALVAETRADVMRDAAGRAVTWRVGELPTVSADLMMLRRRGVPPPGTGVPHARRRHAPDRVRLPPGRDDRVPERAVAAVHRGGRGRPGGPAAGRPPRRPAGPARRVGPVPGRRGGVHRRVPPPPGRRRRVPLVPLPGGAGPGRVRPVVRHVHRHPRPEAGRGRHRTAVGSGAAAGRGRRPGHPGGRHRVDPGGGHRGGPPPDRGAPVGRRPRRGRGRGPGGRRLPVGRVRAAAGVRRASGRVGPRRAGLPDQPAGAADAGRAGGPPGVPGVRPGRLGPPAAAGLARRPAGRAGRAEPGPAAAVRQGGRGVHRGRRGGAGAARPDGGGRPRERPAGRGPEGRGPEEGRVPEHPGPRAPQPAGPAPRRARAGPAGGRRRGRRRAGPGRDGAAARPDGAAGRRPDGPDADQPGQDRPPEGAGAGGPGGAGRGRGQPPAGRGAGPPPVRRPAGRPGPRGRRRGPVVAGVRQPAEQRRQVHGAGAGSASPSGGTGATRSSPSRTPGWGFRRTCRRGCSTCSPKWTAAWRSRRAGWGSG